MPKIIQSCFICTICTPKGLASLSSPVPEPMPDSSHDEISPFTPLAREKRIGLLRTYPPCVFVTVSFWIHIMGMRLMYVVGVGYGT